MKSSTACASGCRAVAATAPLKVVVISSPGGMPPSSVMPSRFISSLSCWKPSATSPLATFEGWGEDRCLLWETARPYFYARTTSDDPCVAMRLRGDTRQVQFEVPLSVRFRFPENFTTARQVAPLRGAELPRNGRDIGATAYLDAKDVAPAEVARALSCHCAWKPLSPTVVAAATRRRPALSFVASG